MRSATRCSILRAPHWASCCTSSKIVVMKGNSRDRRDRLNGWGVGLDAIVPAPPSNTARKRQPVIAVAKALSEVLGIPVCEGCVAKVKSTGQLKDVFDFAK